MLNLETIGKFNGSMSDKHTSHPAIEESCYKKFRKAVCATYCVWRSLRPLQFLSLGNWLNGWKYHKMKQ